MSSAGDVDRVEDDADGAEADVVVLLPDSRAVWRVRTMLSEEEWD